MSRRILVMCPTERELRSLPPLAEKLGVELDFDTMTGGGFVKDFSFGKRLNVPEIIEAKVAQYKRNGSDGRSIEGVVAWVGSPGMTAITAEIARRLHLPGPDPAVILRCDHKYYCRRAQEEYVPDAVAFYRLFNPAVDSPYDPALRYPFFMKPVKSILSYGAHRIDNREQFEEALSNTSMPEGFLEPIKWLIKEFTEFEEETDQFILEELLTGMQVSLEGFVFEGEVTVMAIVEAVLIPGTLSFVRWHYPARIPDEIHQKMTDVARDFMTGVGFDNAPFNMELMYNPQTGSVSIIEVNTKLANQFCDLIEKVDGYNPFTVMMQVAIGDKPEIRRGQGPYNVATSCVFRVFEDMKALSVPTKEDIDAVTARYPDSIIEILAVPGKYLSEQFQDTESYRYALANIGASSYDEIEERFAEIKQMLPFIMERRADKASGESAILDSAAVELDLFGSGISG
ncbi:MAG TPA: ATP-grasp domain-containing protein [Candidatus Melainabacteria bacterium]|nr:ATP-grasp domain-containing protein [Candidatus Melainabacteria bacterium]